MNLSDSLLHSFLPRLGKVPLRFTNRKTWKQGGPVTDKIYFPTPFVKVDDSFKPLINNPNTSTIILNEGNDYVIPNVSKNCYFEAKLYSVTGAKLSLTLERNNSETLIRTRMLTPGVYLLLTNTDSKFETIRIVIQ